MPETNIYEPINLKLSRWPLKILPKPPESFKPEDFSVLAEKFEQDCSKVKSECINWRNLLSPEILNWFYQNLVNESKNKPDILEQLNNHYWLKSWEFGVNLFTQMMLDPKIRQIIWSRPSWDKLENILNELKKPKEEKVEEKLESPNLKKFNDLIKNTAEWVLTPELKSFFLKNWKDLPSEDIKNWIISLSPESVKFLNSRTSKKIRTIMNSKLKDEKISSQEIKSLIWNFEDRFNDNDTDTDIDEKKETKLEKLYFWLKSDLEKNFSWIDISSFFEKLFLHESGWNPKSRDIRIFACSWTWSVWLAQTISTTYNNDQLWIKFNPFNSNQAVVWAMEFFLLEAYSRSRWNWKIKLARALDTYNKWAWWTKVVPNDALLNPNEKRKDKYWNPYNYALKVLKI